MAIVLAGSVVGGFASLGMHRPVQSARTRVELAVHGAITSRGEQRSGSIFEYDEMDFQRATQAFIWALPAVGFHGLHLAQRDTFGAKDGEVVLYHTLEDKAGGCSPRI